MVEPCSLYELIQQLHERISHPVFNVFHLFLLSYMYMYCTISFYLYGLLSEINYYYHYYYYNTYKSTNYIGKRNC